MGDFLKPLSVERTREMMLKRKKGTASAFLRKGIPLLCLRLTGQILYDKAPAPEVQAITQ